MAEYIEREKTLSFPFANGKYDHANANEHFINGCETYKEWLIDIPAADVQPVRHGRWIFGTTMHHDWMKCYECLVSQDVNGCFSYCPNCRAKMGEEEE